jgi:hypothetical protein
MRVKVHQENGGGVERWLRQSKLELMQQRMRKTLIANKLMTSFTPLSSEEYLCPLNTGGKKADTVSVFEMRQYRHFDTHAVSLPAPIPSGTVAGGVSIALRSALVDVLYPTAAGTPSLYRITKLDVSPLRMDFFTPPYHTQVLVPGRPAAVGYIESERAVAKPPPPRLFPQAMLVHVEVEPAPGVPPCLEMLAAHDGVGLRPGYVAVLIDEHPLMPERHFFVFATVNPVSWGITENTWRYVTECHAANHEPLEERRDMRLTDAMDDRVNELTAYVRGLSAKALKGRDDAQDVAVKKRQKKADRRARARSSVTALVLSDSLVGGVVGALRTTFVARRPSQDVRRAHRVQTATTTAERFLARRWNETVKGDSVFIVPFLEA